MMKVNGYRLQHALRELEHAREVAASQFSDNVLQFKSAENPVDIRQVFARFTTLEKKIAETQTAQTQYNLNVQVNVMGKEMPLLQAVKLVGGAGRAEKMWRDTVKGKKNDPYGRYAADQRNKDTEYAVLSVVQDEALKHAQQASRIASALREAIQVGNATEVEVEGLDETSLTP
jgi:hypothetical protein